MLVNNTTNTDSKKRGAFIAPRLAAAVASVRSLHRKILLRILGWVGSKTRLTGMTELGAIIGPIIQAEELIKLDPTVASRFKVRYSDLREQIRKRYGSDIVGEIANTPAIGKLTIEAHARAVVASYNEHLGSGERAWFDQLTQEAVTASERAYALYFKQT